MRKEAEMSSNTRRTGTKIQLNETKKTGSIKQRIYVKEVKETVLNSNTRRSIPQMNGTDV